MAENIALGMDNPPGRRTLSARIREVSTAYGLPLDPDRLVGDLSAGERQRVEIVRCLLQNPKLLIMDEPTSVLTPQEVEILFHTLRKLAEEGTSILYISHKLEEIRSLCEYATVLRHGQVVERCDPREQSAAELAEMMVGSTLHVPKRAGGERGAVLLEVMGLSLPAPSEFGTPLQEHLVQLARRRGAGDRRRRRQRPGRAARGAVGRAAGADRHPAARRRRHRPAAARRAPRARVCSRPPRSGSATARRPA